MSIDFFCHCANWWSQSRVSALFKQFRTNTRHNINTLTDNAIILLYISTCGNWHTDSEKRLSGISLCQKVKATSSRRAIHCPLNHVQVSFPGIPLSLNMLLWHKQARTATNCVNMQRLLNFRGLPTLLQFNLGEIWIYVPEFTTNYAIADETFQ